MEFGQQIIKMRDETDGETEQDSMTEKKIMQVP